MHVENRRDFLKKLPFRTAAVATAPLLFSTACDTRPTPSVEPSTDNEREVYKTYQLYKRAKEAVGSDKAVLIAVAALYNPNEDLQPALMAYKKATDEGIGSNSAAVMAMGSGLNGYTINDLIGFYREALKHENTDYNSAAALANLAVVDKGNLSHILSLNDQVQKNDFVGTENSPTLVSAALINNDVNKTLEMYRLAKDKYYVTIDNAAILTVAAALSQGDMQKVVDVYQKLYRNENLIASDAASLATATVINGYNRDGVMEMYNFLKRQSDTFGAAGALTLATVSKASKLPIATQAVTESLIDVIIDYKIFCALFC